MLSLWYSGCIDDTSKKGTEFCSSNGDSYPGMTAYNASLVYSLPWLPITHRSKYRILECAYEALNGTVPRHLEELIVPYQPVRSRRPQSGSLISVPKLRCFSKDAATLWINLPLNIKKCITLATFSFLYLNISYNFVITHTYTHTHTHT